METLILVARVGLSLAAVLGLLWWFSRRMQSSTTLRRRRREELVVLGKQQLGGKSGVALDRGIVAAGWSSATASKA